MVWLFSFSLNADCNEGEETVFDDNNLCKSYSTHSKCLRVLPCLCQDKRSKLAVYIGYGTGGGRNEAAHEALVSALATGCRHIDCAPRYRNQRELNIPRALARTGLAREKLHVTSKLWSTCHAPNIVRDACLRTLDELGLAALDLYLLHSPVALKFTGGLRDKLDVFVPRDETTGHVLLDPSNPTLAQTWRAMVALREEGLVKEIGVSNFSLAQIDEMMAGGTLPKPWCNQIELHPYLPQHALVAGLQVS